MALRIGKKKQDTSGGDWSEAALLAQTEDDASASTPVSDPPSTVTVPATDTVATEPADAFVADALVADAATPKKKAVSPLLAAGLALLLAAGAVGAYLMFFSAPPEDEAPPVVAQSPTRPSPPAPAAKAPAAKAPAPTNPAGPGAPPATGGKAKAIPVRPRPGAPPQRVRPGRAGIVPPGTRRPAVRPRAGKPPAMVPKPNQPTPVPVMPDFQAGQAGKGLQPGSTVAVVAPGISPALRAQLKALWQQGAAAKWRGDYAAARRAWQKMLQLRPGHPGVQEAINKLPR